MSDVNVIAEKPECRYSRWGEGDNQFLVDNFGKLSNAQIAERLKRTTDSVRKQANKLELVRPKKSAKKKKVSDMLKMMSSGRKLRKEKEQKVKTKQREELRENRKKIKVADELRWAQKYLAPETKPTVTVSRGPKRALRIDDKTTVFIPIDADPQPYLDKYRNRKPF